MVILKPPNPMTNNDAPSKKHRTAIIGVGDVGAAVANALILRSVTDEVLINDIDSILREAQIYDLSDVSYVCGGQIRVRAATHREAGQADIVIITIGSRHFRGETNVQHTFRKLSTFRSIISSMKPFGPNTILIVVANPVDIFTSFVYKLSGLPATRVIGSGTWLDSIRMSNVLAERTNADPSSINLPILGVNGKSQVIAWSTASIGDTPVDEIKSQTLPSVSAPPGLIDRESIHTECIIRKDKMLRGKGKIPLGIGSLVTRICEAIVSDQGRVCLVSQYQPKWDCCFSSPAALGKTGIVKTVEISMLPSEWQDLEETAKELRERVDQIHEGQ
ncbi:hypothetical protein PDE_01078 [Penicillium oxalicum 114-2]|uniref:Lactate/malate dehydrogenase N-terminal domain-containing protein n=1 Tax=Penicillium oxalicum (strain 114-2 / CGMCC 5302) TaxID=933388 RepID=S8AW83_PENO1|nr:hypothetical protein PDE_01078 [Penicillium oxalicum 114-2]